MLHEERPRLSGRNGRVSCPAAQRAV